MEKIDKICKYFEISREELIKKRVKSNAEIAFIRHITFYILLKDLKNKEVKELFGVDHGTIIYGEKKIRGFIDISDERTLKALEKLN